MIDDNIFNELNEQQQNAVNCSLGNKLILAGAGSGKTRVLTCRVAKLIDSFNVSHGMINATGYIFDGIAYISDCNDLSIKKNKAFKNPLSWLSPIFVPNNNKF